MYWQRQEQVDPITLIANARYFDRFFCSSNGSGINKIAHAISLILCAPDNFETYQDRYGRPGPLTKVCGKLLKSCSLPLIQTLTWWPDTATGRFGIVLPTTSLDGALRVANRNSGRRRQRGLTGLLPALSPNLFPSAWELAVPSPPLTRFAMKKFPPGGGDLKTTDQGPQGIPRSRRKYLLSISHFEFD